MLLAAARRQISRRKLASFFNPFQTFKLKASTSFLNQSFREFQPMLGEMRVAQLVISEAEHLNVFQGAKVR